MKQDVAALRQDYHKGGLDEAMMKAHPMEQFSAWFDDARVSGIFEPNLMTLATASPDGKPTVRTLLLKGFDSQGFVFFTNYESRKGRQLLANPHAAMVFWWDRLERQVSIEGTVEKLSEAESTEYFHSRPRESQLGAWASIQSTVLPDRETLDRRFLDAAARFEDREVDKPAYWGGYYLHPTEIEFWQGRPGRMHDRIRYYLEGDRWTMHRLSP